MCSIPGQLWHGTSEDVHLHSLHFCIMVWVKSCICSTDSSPLDSYPTRDWQWSGWMAHWSCTGAHIKSINDLCFTVIEDTLFEISWPSMRDTSLPLRQPHVILNICSRKVFGFSLVVTSEDTAERSCNASAPLVIILSGMLSGSKKTALSIG